MFFKLILAFSPWLAFLLIAHDSLFRLKLGLAVGLVLSVVMGITRLHRGDHLMGGIDFLQLRDAGSGGIQQRVDRKTHGHNGQRGNGCCHLAVHYYQETIYHGLRPAAYRAVALGQSAVHPDEHCHNRSLGPGLHVQHHSGLGQDGTFCIVRAGLRGHYLYRAHRDGILYELVSGSYSSRKSPELTGES